MMVGTYHELWEKSRPLPCYVKSVKIITIALRERKREYGLHQMLFSFTASFLSHHASVKDVEPYGFIYQKQNG